jgi:transposase
MDTGRTPMTKAEGEVSNPVRRRRRWSRADKERIVAAAMEPGAVASAVARDAGIQASQLFRWRQQLRGPARARFASLTLEVPSDAAVIRSDAGGAPQDAVAATGSPRWSGVIEIVFGTGTRLRICGPVEPPIISAVMQALADCQRR